MTTVRPKYTSQGAEFDEDRIYRYKLHRYFKDADDGWDHELVLWVMLNPSTADETVLDPTLRRCEGFTRQWGYDGFMVGNLFAYRATNPDVMWKERLCGMDVVGERNDDAIRQMAAQATYIVVGWGSHPMADDRATKVIRILLQSCDEIIWCLGTNSLGSPKHPLYLPATAKRIPFPVPSEVITYPTDRGGLRKA